MNAAGDKSVGDIEEEETGRKLSAVELSLRNLENRIFELELFRAIAEETTARLKIRENEVAEEIRKLDQLQYERWESRNDFCENLWKLSAEHDLRDILNRYLDTPKRMPHEFVTIDPNEHPEVQELKTDLEQLKNQLLEKKDIQRSLNEKIMQSKIQLQITKNYGDRDPEIICLKKDIKDYEEKYFDLESKMATMEMNFDDWSEPPKAETKEIKRSFIKASELIAQQEINDNAKKSRFSVKRESAISRKFTSRRT